MNEIHIFVSYGQLIFSHRKKTFFYSFPVLCILAAVSVACLASSPSLHLSHLATTALGFDPRRHAMPALVWSPLAVAAASGAGLGVGVVVAWRWGERLC